MMLLLDIEFYISLAVQPTDIKGDKFVTESLGHLLINSQSSEDTQVEYISQKYT